MHRAAQIVPRRDELPRLGPREHRRDDLHGTGRARSIAQRVMQRSDVAPLDRAHCLRAERWEDVAIENTSVRRHRARLAVHLHVHAHEPLGETRHGELGLGRCGRRLLAPLDAVDDHGRLLSGLVGGDLAVKAKRDPLRSAGASRLHHVDLAASGHALRSPRGHGPKSGYPCRRHTRRRRCASSGHGAAILVWVG